MITPGFPLGRTKKKKKPREDFARNFPYGEPRAYLESL